MRVRVPVQMVANVQIPASNNVSNTYRIMPWCQTTLQNANSNVLAGNSGQCLGCVHTTMFQAYRNLFDEVKCDGIKFKVTLLENIGIGGTWKGVNVLTAIDRHYGPREPVPTYANIEQYASVSQTMFVNNSVSRVVRSCYAVDLIEKSMFTDSDTNADITNAISLAGWNSQVSTLFSPCIFVSVATDANAGPQGATITFKVEGYVYLTFRNPKSSGAPASKEEAIDRVIASNPEFARDIVSIGADLGDDDEAPPNKLRRLDADLTQEKVDALLDEATRQGKN